MIFNNLTESNGVRLWGLGKFAKLGPLLIIGACLVTPSIASAITLFSQGYFTNNQLPTGSIVSLQKDSSDHVEASNIGNNGTILGVIVDSGNTQLSLSSGQSNQVQVATSGVVQLLISDINGKVAVGDSITSSPINGVGMKASDNTKIIGIAQDLFPNTTSKEQSYNDKKGVKHTVLLGEISVQVNVSYFYKQPEKTVIASAIQNIANALAGKQVKPLPILISLGIFLVSLIVVVSIIYAMIRSSIISVGRNPMAQSAIYRNVIQLSVLIVIILGVTVVSIYLLLARL